MRTVPSALATHLALEVTTLATWWKLTLTNGTVYGYTSHDEDIVIDSVTYSATHGYTPTGIDSSDKLNVDNLDLSGFIAATGLTAADIGNGLLDGAEVSIGIVNWASPSDGVVVLLFGYLGTITRTDSTYTAELRSLHQKLQQHIVDIHSPSCRAVLGDSRCGVVVDPGVWQASTAYDQVETGDQSLGDVVRPSTANNRHYVCTTAGTSGGSEPTWNTTIDGTTSDGSVTWKTVYARKVLDVVVSAVTDNKNFTASSLGGDFPGNYWKAAVIEWKTGNNAGAKQLITYSNASTGDLTLYFYTSGNIQVGDTFDMTVVCPKDFDVACKVTYDNAYNFRGEPHIPGKDAYVTGTRS